MEQENRVVVLIDMDCFYCQVEEKLDPQLKGKPIAVVQYNPWKGGGIIAVNYVARAMGVTRHMRGDEAKEKCPEIVLPSVPCLRGKADISKYRDAGKEVARVLQKFTTLLERASIDEAYLDITAPVQERLKSLNVNTVTTEIIPNTYALGYDSVEDFVSDVHSCSSDSIEFDYEHARRLLVGAVIVSEIRAAVYEETGYRCSAGIAHNKILAKLVCGMNKPNKQTLLPKHSVNILYKTLALKKVKHLGGKFGDTVCEVLKITKMGELQKFSEKELQARFDEKNGAWLYNIARGIDLEPVQARFNPKSIGCCKQLRGKSALYDLDGLRKWLKDLGDEIEDRLEKDSLENNRTPKQMVVSFTTQAPDGRDTSSSRSYNFIADDELCGDMFANKALELVLESLEGAKVIDGESNRKLKAPIKFLGISVGKFEDHSESKKIKKIVDYFGAGPSNVTKSKDDAKPNVVKDSKNKDKMNEGKEFIMQKFLQRADKCKVQDTGTKEEPIKGCIQQNEENDTKKNGKKNEGKEFIMQKFLQGTDKCKIRENEIKVEKQNDEFKPVIQSTLDKQESFFTKFLNAGPMKDPTVSHLSTANNDTNTNSLRPTTPLCNVVNCGEDSNDSEYSGSTINMEINKSIALFDDDPQDVARVSNMRDLLNKSTARDDSNEELPLPPEANTIEAELVKPTVIKETTPEILEEEMFECNECKKKIPAHMFETHGDYHFALKLREEERQRVRSEFKEKTKSTRLAVSKTVTTNEQVKKKKVTDEQSKNDAASISTFFVKIDNSTPSETCSECGKRVPLDKFTEHLDFHEAQKLSRELNKRDIPTVPSYTATPSVKRKRKTISPVKNPKLSCSRSIDSFFR
ncbi:DNA polymerase eta [Pectinophora gossypiella]|uniref:DNA polymerase eta n=1 Tax=Pectinophora gossypiella TaxID=13191 RepID=UPI00214E119F|nr:DNA polymerase eta [Pectinophora gossypiella]